jgi:hypothetical protein
MYIYCIFAVFYYVNVCCLSVKWHMKQLKKYTYAIDMFHIQLSLNGALILEM